MHLLPIFLLCVLQASPVPPVVDGKALPQVPGPLAPRSPDPAGGPGSDPIQMALRKSARTGSIPAVGLPAGPLQVQDTMDDLPGWKAYRIEVPPKATVKVRLKGLHESWFRVRAMNHWGEQEQGMLQNRIPTGNPEASYINPKAEGHAVFFVVDTTETSMGGEAFSLWVTFS